MKTPKRNKIIDLIDAVKENRVLGLPKERTFLALLTAYNKGRLIILPKYGLN